MYCLKAQITKQCSKSSQNGLMMKRIVMQSYKNESCNDSCNQGSIKEQIFDHLEFINL